VFNFYQARWGWARSILRHVCPQPATFRTSVCIWNKNVSQLEGIESFNLKAGQSNTFPSQLCALGKWATGVVARPSPWILQCAPRGRGSRSSTGGGEGGCRGRGGRPHTKSRVHKESRGAAAPDAASTCPPPLPPPGRAPTTRPPLTTAGGSRQGGGRVEEVEGEGECLGRLDGCTPHHAAAAPP
jgi:hypothetical protein